MNYELSLLNKKEKSLLNNIETQVKDNHKKRQIFRTATEMMFSVLNDAKFPTNAAKYWQSVREQSVHYEELVRLSFKYRKLLVDIDEKSHIIDTLAGSVFDMRRSEIEIDELAFEKELMEQIAEDRVREIHSWHGIMQVLSEAEDFDTEDVDAHQAESYLKILQNKAESITQGTNHAEVFNIIGQLNTLKRLKGIDPIPIEEYTK
tara:strand:- start:1386 stop:2000 length:615 start_codon:yes stop_codon:yes gene_type:complete